jgi:hypothetical protein
MDSFGLPSIPGSDIYDLQPNVRTQGEAYWGTWRKPLNRRMCSMIAIGAGGQGGDGRINANSTAGGGAGGGSGAMTCLTMPLAMLPDVCYYQVGQPIIGNGAPATRLATYPTIANSNHVVIYAVNGNQGNSSSSGSGGTAPTAAAASLATDMPMGWMFRTNVLAGQAGIAGGAAVAGAALTLPTTGLIVTGGTGGGGLPAAAATGTNGGSFTVPAAPGAFPAQAGGAGSATATDPAANGNSGFWIKQAGLYFYGGTGGASTHGTATGAGLQQSRGGDGGIGCGGGGSGGALTGSAAGSPGVGGRGLLLIVCW